MAYMRIWTENSNGSIFFLARNYSWKILSVNCSLINRKGVGLGGKSIGSFRAGSLLESNRIEYWSHRVHHRQVFMGENGIGSSLDTAYWNIMSARSPFRSHLLQQWTNSRRSPIVVQQWLNQETIHEEEEWPSSAPSRLSLSPNRRQHSRRSFHNSSRQQDSLGLSSVDTSPSSPSTALAASSWVASLKAEEKRERYSGGLSAGAPIDFKDRQKVQNTLFDVVTPCNLATNKHGRTLSNHSMKNNIFNSVGETTNSSTFTATNRKTDPKKDLQKSELSMAIDRAVKLSRTTHLYQDHLAKANEGQPFTFRKLLCSSRKGRHLKYAWNAFNTCSQWDLRQLASKLDRSLEYDLQIHSYLY